MRTQYDVIICGGGPAGAAAGTTLARQGLDVLILDKARFPRKKLCGGLLTWKSVRLLETVFGETIDSLSGDGIINYASDQYTIRSLSDTLAQGRLTFPFHLVDRTLFDAHLLAHAEQAGAETVQEAKVATCDPNQGLVRLDGGETFSGTYIIGADGANSVVRNTFPGYDRQRFQTLMAPTVEVSIPRSDFPHPVDYPELVIGILNAGYGWVFPNRDAIVVGICGLREDKFNYSKLFREYLDFLEIDFDVVPPFKGHPLPYGNYLGNPVHGRTLLAGDAGGYVEPLLGEGLFFALCSGHYAGQSIAEGLAQQSHPGPLYTRRMYRDIMPELKASDRLRWVLFRAMKHLGPKSIGLFVRSLPTPLTEMVHGMRSYAWLRRKQWEFLD